MSDQPFLSGPYDYAQFPDQGFLMVPESDIETANQRIRELEEQNRQLQQDLDVANELLDEYRANYGAL